MYVYKCQGVNLDNFLASKDRIKNIIPTALESKFDILNNRSGTNTISLHVINILVHGVINLLY